MEQEAVFAMHVIAGTSIDVAIQNAKAKALEEQRVVKFQFNHVTIRVEPHQSASSIYLQYEDRCRMAHLDWVIHSRDWHFRPGTVEGDALAAIFSKPIAANMLQLELVADGLVVAKKMYELDQMGLTFMRVEGGPATFAAALVGKWEPIITDIITKAAAP